MLVDIPESFAGPECPARKRYDEMNATVRADDPAWVDLELRAPERLAQGVYVNTGMLTSDLRFAGLATSEFVFRRQRQKAMLNEDGSIRDDYDWFDELDKTPADYGVCDDYTQILERWPQLLEDEREFIIVLDLFTRAGEPERGGWRWHKWVSISASTSLSVST
jgi:hypothetical protein